MGPTVCSWKTPGRTGSLEADHSTRATRPVVACAPEPRPRMCLAHPGKHRRVQEPTASIRSRGPIGIRVDTDPRIAFPTDPARVLQAGYDPRGCGRAATHDEPIHIGALPHAIVRHARELLCTHASFAIEGARPREATPAGRSLPFASPRAIGRDRRIGGQDAREHGDLVAVAQSSARDVHASGARGIGRGCGSPRREGRL